MSDEVREYLSKFADENAQLKRDLAALRQRHAEAVEKAFREGYNTDHEAWLRGEDPAWLASEAKQGLT